MRPVSGDCSRRARRPLAGREPARSHWASLAAIAEDNPDLPMAMIRGILEAQAELRAGLGQPYPWGLMERA